MGDHTEPEKSPGEEPASQNDALPCYKLPEWFLKHNVKTLAEIDSHSPSISFTDAKNEEHSRDVPPNQGCMDDKPVEEHSKKTTENFNISIFSRIRNVMAATLMRNQYGRPITGSAMLLEYPSCSNPKLVPEIAIELARDLRCDLISVDLEDLQDLALEFHAQEMEMHAASPTEILDSQPEHAYEPPKQKPYFDGQSEKKASPQAWETNRKAIFTVLDASRDKLQRESAEGSQQTSLGQNTNETNNNDHRPRPVLIHFGEVIRMVALPNGWKYLLRFLDFIQQRRNIGDDIALFVTLPGHMNVSGSYPCSCHGCSLLNTTYSIDELLTGRARIAPSLQIALEWSNVQKVAPDRHAYYTISVNVRQLMRNLRNHIPQLLPPELRHHYSDTIRCLFDNTLRPAKVEKWGADDIEEATIQLIGRAWGQEVLTVKDIVDVLVQLNLLDASKKAAPESELPKDSENTSAKDEDKQESWWEKKARVVRTCNSAEMDVLNCLIDPDELHTSFDEVIIDQEIKDSVRSVLSLGSARLKGPANSLLRRVCSQGALFYGPPGTGKTHLARAIAKECGASMIELDAASVQSKYVSETENKIKAAFSLAAKLFPCVLFIDEVDALFYRRGDGDKSWERSQLTQFLKEMDGLGENTKAPMVVVATNRPDDLDEAFLRRLPRKVYFGLPDATYRAKILEVLLKSETLDPLLDVKTLARRTEGYSGSDLRNLCSEAALNWATENIIPQFGKTPSEVLPNMQLGVTHFAKALKSIRPSVSQRSLHHFSEFYSRFNPRIDQSTSENEEAQLLEETDSVNPSIRSLQSGSAPMPHKSKDDSLDEMTDMDQFFPKTIENMQTSIRQVIRLRELPMFHSGRWQPKSGATKNQPTTSEKSEDKGRVLDLDLQDGVDSNLDNPLDIAKFPAWMESMELLTPDVKGIKNMIPDLTKLMENRPKNWDSMIKGMLAKLGPDTQKNMQEFAEDVREMMDIGSTSRERNLDYERKFNGGVYQIPPPRELAICLKCRHTGHFSSQCLEFPDSTSIPPDSQYGTVGQLLKLLDGDIEPLKKPRRVQLRAASGSKIKICENCRSIPFGALFPSNESDDDYDQINIFRDHGHITGVFFRQDCPLCVLLVNSTPDNVAGIDSYVIIYSQLNIRRQLGAVSPKPGMPSRIMGLGIIHRPYEKGSFGIWKNSALNRLSEAPEAVGLIEQPSDSGKLPYLGARLLNPDRLSVPLIHDWIDRCDQKHPRTCVQTTPPDLKHIRLIDVHERKLVPFPGSDGCEYIALSYVWGGIDLSSYTMGTQLGQLPATLEDAVTVTKLLGKRFLWIDAICIDQSDPKDKAVQINLMNIIYSSAWLTIVALWGDKANSGLFGPSRDQLSCEISGKTFATTFGTLQQQVRESVWGNRAWTLQEGLLSPRCLYFSKDQLYFSCNSAGSCEAVDDTTSPYHEMDTLKKYPYFGSGEVIFRNPFVNFDPNDLEHIGGGPISVKGRLFDYGRFLKQYMRRQMSHDSDSLNAFEGVLKLLAVHLYTDGFFQGLPVEDMPMALLWEASGKPRRRPGFPAWSWAGWETHLSKAHGLDAKREQPQQDSWRRPFIEIRKSVNGKLELIHSSGPSETGPNLSHYSFKVKDGIPDFPVPREGLPPDPFWDLRQVVMPDSGYSADLMRKGEEEKYLFLDCITIVFSIGLEDSMDEVMIGDTKCKLVWQRKEESWENEVRNRSKKPQEFIVLARNSPTLQLLLIDLSEDGITATRVTSAHLHIQSLDERMTGEKFEEMKLTFQSLYGSTDGQGNGIDTGKLAFLRESWANKLLREANCLRRRQLVLV